MLAGELLLLEEVAPPLLLPQAPPPGPQDSGQEGEGRQEGEVLVDLAALLLGEDQEGVHRPLDAHCRLLVG